jgi:hypothetical protein
LTFDLLNTWVKLKYLEDVGPVKLFLWVLPRGKGSFSGLWPDLEWATWPG